MENTKTFIEVWIRNEDNLHEAYGSAYNYALYLCGGDFTMFDDINVLIYFLSSQPILPSKKYLAQQMGEEYSIDLPF